MHRLIIQFAFLLLLPALLIAQEESLAPKLLVQPARDHDFGDISHRDKPEHRFDLENISPDTIRITHVKSSCGCTAAMINDSVLAPGAKAGISVKFYPPRDASGIIHKSIVVYLEGNNRPETLLRITANLLSDFSLSTKKLDIGTVAFRTPVTVYFEITNTSKEPRDIVNIQSGLAIEGRDSNENFVHPIPMNDVKISPQKRLLPPGDRMKVAVTFTPQQRGRIMGSAIITTTDENMQVEVTGESK